MFSKAVNAATGVGDGSVFSLPMIRDVAIARGTGTATFTRASSAYEKDNEEVTHKILSGVPVFPGMRPVTNLLTYSEDFSNAVWMVSAGGTGVIAVKTPNYGLAPDGSQTACRIQLNKGVGATVSDFSRLSHSFPTTAVNTRIQAYFWIKTTDDSVKIIDFGITADRSITVDGTWRQFADTTTLSRDSVSLFLRGGLTPANSDSADILIWHPQLEDVTNLTNQNPAEYIPTTSAAVTKWFNYENPYTVDANGVVTDSGLRTPLAGKGFLSEPASVNKCVCFGVPRADALGAELVTVTADRDFSSDTLWWSKHTGTTISGGAANFSSVAFGEGIYKSGIYVKGKFYSITFTILSSSAGSFKINGSSVSRSIPGTYTEIVGPIAVANVGIVAAMAGTTGSIDNVSIKEAIDYVGTKAYHDGTVFQNPITGMTLSGDVAAVLSIVADQAEVDAAKLGRVVNGGKVYKLDNSLGSAIAYLAIIGYTGNINTHTMSVIGRRLIGGVIIDALGSSEVSIASSSYNKYAKTIAGASSTNYMRLRANTGGTVYFLLPQLEELPFSTSIMPSEGATATRAATILSIPLSGNMPLTGRRFFSDYWTPKAVIAGRTEVIAYSGQDTSNYVQASSNGTAISFTKMVAGVSEAATLAMVPVAGTQYHIEAWLNPDNTLGLKVNSTPAGTNTSTTLAPVFGSVMFIGSNGVTPSFAQYQNMRITN